MSFQVNFNTHGKELNAAYQAVISEKDDTNWLIYAFDKGTYDIRVQETGNGGLEELNDEFSDGKVQFAFAKVIDPNTELPKFVFIGWCGSGVPELRKAFFNSQLSDVSKFFKSFHVQINARDEADVEPSLIMRRVAESSGANYSVHKESAKPQPRVVPVNSVYKKTEVPDIAAMQRESMTKENAPKPVGTNYKPVTMAPKKLEQRWNQQQQQDNSGANAVRAERERFEKEVRDREIEKSRQVVSQPPVSQTPPPAPARPTFDQDRKEEEARQREQLRRQQEEEEQERVRQEQQEIARHQQREQEERQNLHRYQQQEEEEARRRQQDQERAAAAAAAEQDRLREQEDDRARQQQEQQRRDQERRALQEEEERLRLEDENRRQQFEEAERRRQEEEREEEELRQRQEEEEYMRRQELDQMADKAVHTADVTAAAVVHSSKGVSAVVLFAYDASENNEMSLAEGEVVHQIDQVDEGWWFGVSEDGTKQGLFPANYVQILEATHEPTPAATPDATPAAHTELEPVHHHQEEKQQQGATAVALYEYEAEEDNEISFHEGDTISQIEFVSDDWWQGTNGKSHGLFPANYVELKQ